MIPAHTASPTRNSRGPQQVVTLCSYGSPTVVVSDTAAVCGASSSSEQREWVSPGRRSMKSHICTPQLSKEWKEGVLASSTFAGAGEEGGHHLTGIYVRSAVARLRGERGVRRISPTQGISADVSRPRGSFSGSGVSVCDLRAYYFVWVAPNVLPHPSILNPVAREHVDKPKIKGRRRLAHTKAMGREWRCWSPAQF